MIAREVEGPLWSVPVLGPKPLLSHCGPSWAALGAYAGGLGPLSGLCGRSWAALEAYVGGLGPLFGPMLAVLGHSLAPMLAVWDCSWSLSWRSWAAFATKWSVLGRFRA